MQAKEKSINTEWIRKPSTKIELFSINIWAPISIRSVALCVQAKIKATSSPYKYRCLNNAAHKAEETSINIEHICVLLTPLTMAFDKKIVVAAFTSWSIVSPFFLLI
jgi:hypothetical protein